MFRLSKKINFTILALLDIAYYSNGTPIQSTEISQRQGIPVRYLEQALQKLVKVGILKGVRGPKGGYSLARERRLITIVEIIRVVQNWNDKNFSDNGVYKSLLSKKVFAPVWFELNQSVMANLDSITIGDLCNKAIEKGIESNSLSNLDFSI